MHCRSATRELDRREHGEESSAAMQARAAMLRDAARQVVEAAAEEVERAAAEEDRSAHWAAELITALARHQGEWHREAQRRETRHRAVVKQRRQEAI
jgi:hypothetical protein